MNLDDITKELTGMSDEELFKLLGEIRQSRRTSKRVNSTGKGPSAQGKRPPGSKVNPSTIIKALSPEDRAKLIAMLEGNDETGDDTEE